MSLNNLRPPKGAKQSPKRVGRGPGSGLGKTAGRGHKGAQSRSGWKAKRGFEGGQMPLHRRLPKRGFHNPFRTEYVVVNLDTLASAFEPGAVVTPELLRERGLLPGAKRPVKVLARGDLGIALTVRADKFSGKAAAKIKAAGGAVESLSGESVSGESVPAESLPGKSRSGSGQLSGTDQPET
jgi:large subunit ribosomal protein L15